MRVRLVEQVFSGDPWGADTSRSSNSAFQPQNFTSYIRDGNGQQDAMARRYSPTGRFSQPDPYSGSYDFSDPQSLNRYAYTKNDPVNFRDPSGLGIMSILRAIGRWLKEPKGSRGGGGGPSSDIGGMGVVEEEEGGDPQNTGSLAPNGLASDRRLTDAECDKRLAAIFGGPGAVVGSTRDPLTVGSNPNALAYAEKYGRPADRIGERGPGHGPEPYDNPHPKSGDRGGIIHIFGNAQGTRSGTPLYAPSGGAVGRIAKDSQNNSYRRVSYSTGLTITFMHVIPGGGPGRSGSVVLGTIGGPDSGGDNYRHNHLIFYSNFAKGIRVDPRKVFCGQ